MLSKATSLPVWQLQKNMYLSCNNQSPDIHDCSHDNKLLTDAFYILNLNSRTLQSNFKDHTTFWHSAGFCLCVGQAFYTTDRPSAYPWCVYMLLLLCVCVWLMGEALYWYLLMCPACTRVVSRITQVCAKEAGRVKRDRMVDGMPSTT